MAHAIPAGHHLPQPFEPRPGTLEVPAWRFRWRVAGYQAYELLHIAFVTLAILVGFDKFANLLTNWETYLAAPIRELLPLRPTSFMRVVGIVEIWTGFLLAVKPRIGAYVLAGWLAAIVVNLTLAGRYDIALRDVGLCVAALALARLSFHYTK